MQVSDDDGDEGKAVEDISGDEKVDACNDLVRVTHRMTLAGPQDEPKVDNKLGVGAEDEDDDEDLQVHAHAHSKRARTERPPYGSHHHSSLMRMGDALGSFGALLPDVGFIHLFVKCWPFLKVEGTNSELNEHGKAAAPSYPTSMPLHVRSPNLQIQVWEHCGKLPPQLNCCAAGRN